MKPVTTSTFTHTTTYYDSEWWAKYIQEVRDEKINTILDENIEKNSTNHTKLIQPPPS